MDIEIIGATFEFVGTVFIAYAALKVHHRILYEHKMDEKVFNVMRREQVIGIAGVIMVVIGYVIHLSIII